MKHECTIGLLFRYEDVEFVTFNRLKEIHESDVESYELFKNDPIYKKICVKPQPIKSLLDLRKNLMHHFMYCPECGKQINWAALRKSVEESEESK